MSLQQNPKMRELLKAPDFMKAVSAGDITALMANPKFVELLNNPDIKEIQKKSSTPNRECLKLKKNHGRNKNGNAP